MNLKVFFWARRHNPKAPTPRFLSTSRLHKLPLSLVQQSLSITPTTLHTYFSMRSLSFLKRMWHSSNTSTINEDIHEIVNECNDSDTSDSDISDDDIDFQSFQPAESPEGKEHMERIDSMMDISSSGSTDNMEAMYGDDEEEEEEEQRYAPVAALHSGVFGVSKLASDIPQTIEDSNCNILGEDSYFVFENAVGIFDGVGGWKSNGVDPSEYSGTLARECLAVACNDCNVDPVYILENAYSKLGREQKVIGSSTACIVCLEQEQSEDGESTMYLNTAYVGDSGYMIIRRDRRSEKCRIVFKSQEQQHYFNAPFQLALVHGRFAHLQDTIFNDKPEDAILERHEIAPGDIVVTGTDGVLDNLFDYEIVEIVEALYNHHPTDIARAIVQESYYRSVSMEETPFERNAKLAGQYFKGGKRDDISTIVSRVVEITDA